jgi:hypothetical protein
MMYGPEQFWVMFHVNDRYVRSIQTAYQSPVCTDSCVEFFLQPRSDKGYFNFEINCCGTLLAHYVEDPTRRPSGALTRSTPPAENRLSQVRIATTLKHQVEPEIQEPLEWSVSCEVPLLLLRDFVGPLAPLDGQTWKGNFFKCGDATSHPHWASWSAIGEQLNFHQPKYFSPLYFQEPQQM